MGYRSQPLIKPPSLGRVSRGAKRTLNSTPRQIATRTLRKATRPKRRRQPAPST